MGRISGKILITMNRTSIEGFIELAIAIIMALSIYIIYSLFPILTMALDLSSLEQVEYIINQIIYNPGFRTVWFISSIILIFMPAISIYILSKLIQEVFWWDTLIINFVPLIFFFALNSSFNFHSMMLILPNILIMICGGSLGYLITVVLDKYLESQH